MHGQENYAKQAGQGSYTSPSSFQQYPAPPSAPSPLPPPPPPPPHGPLPPPPPVGQQEHSSFQHAPGSFGYPRGRPHQVPGPPSGMHRPYLTPPQPQQAQGSNQFSPWAQNVHQFPLRASNAYPLPSSQGYLAERGPAHQTPFQHALPPPPPPPYSSTSNISTPNPSGSSGIPGLQYSYIHTLGPLPPPPPRPPPPPPPVSSPPRVPPLPPSSPPSDNILKSDGVGSLDEHQFHGDDLGLERSSSTGLSGSSNAHTINALSHSTVRNQPEIEAADTFATHSPADSDMDMEDDITQPDEEKQNGLSNNLNNGGVSLSEELDAEEQAHASHHTGGGILPKVAVDGYIHFTGSAMAKDQRVGTEIPSSRDTSVTEEINSEADDLGITENIDTEQPVDVNVIESLFKHEIFSEPAETGNEELSSQAIGGEDSFGLLQGYTSDGSLGNDDENFLRDVTPSLKVESTNFDTSNEHNSGSESKIEILSESNKLFVSKPMTKSPKDAVEADKTVFGTTRVEELSEKSHRYEESIRDRQPKYSSRNYDVDSNLEGANVPKSDGTNNSDKMNVDEFGRLVREGVSDSDDSDSPRFTRKHSRRDRKRIRSPSRSRSPHDRRRRRSPRRRKERRGRSRSSSPDRRRSRSRSPVLRRGAESVVDKMRREKSKLPQCFDFLRGKCYRGATCRYSHNESDKSERGRYNRGKHRYQDRSPSPGLSEEDKVHRPRSSDHENKEMKDEGVKLPLDVPTSEELTDVKEFTSDPQDRLNHLESAPFQVGDDLPSNLSSQDLPKGADNFVTHNTSAHYPDEVPQVDRIHKQIDGSLISEPSFLVEASTVTLTDHTADKSDAELGANGRQCSVGSPLKKNHVNVDVPSQPHLPSVSGSQVTSVLGSVPVVQQIPQDYNLMPHTVLHSKPENNSIYQAPVSYQYPHFPQQPNSSSSFMLPPPPPRVLLPVNMTTGQHNIPSLHMQQASMHPQNDLQNLPSFASMRPYPTELPTQSQTSQSQAYPSAQNPDQNPHIRDDFRSSNLPTIEEDRLSGHVVRGMNHLQPVAQSQPNSLWMPSGTQGTHASVAGHVPSNSSSSHSLPYFHQGSYGQQYSAADGFSSQFGDPAKVNSSVSRTTGDLLEMTNHSHVPGLVESRISNHFNPYASTFDQPLSIKFSLNASSQENNTPVNTMYVTPFPLSSASVDAHRLGSIGSKNMVASSSSARVAENFSARPGGDQYDPLFDSIEPSQNSLSKADRQHNETIGDSDDFLRLSASGKQLNRVNMEQEGGASVSANDSLKLEEFGETADAEVGAVVNGSPSNSNDEADMNAGEIEIDQVKASGKKKQKGKDSRSTNLFKSSIASFVKEVLKPSWRQGNMSKEAFKTIVKKTVDKVSGAMKSHKMPRSQAKINHYIDSSRGKLTKLVMGYVDKYVKM